MFDDLLRLLSGWNIARKSIPGPATTFIVLKSWYTDYCCTSVAAL